jgi:hypothetical protein
MRFNQPTNTPAELRRSIAQWFYVSALVLKFTSEDIDPDTLSYINSLIVWGEHAVVEARKQSACLRPIGVKIGDMQSELRLLRKFERRHWVDHLRKEVMANL